MLVNSMCFKCHICSVKSQQFTFLLCNHIICGKCIWNLMQRTEKFSSIRCTCSKTTYFNQPSVQHHNQQSSVKNTPNHSHNRQKSIHDNLEQEIQRHKCTSSSQESKKGFKKLEHKITTEQSSEQLLLIDNVQMVDSYKDSNGDNDRSANWTMEQDSVVENRTEKTNENQQQEQEQQKQSSKPKQYYFIKKHHDSDQEEEDAFVFNGHDNHNLTNNHNYNLQPSHNYSAEESLLIDQSADYWQQLQPLEKQEKQINRQSTATRSTTTNTHKNSRMNNSDSYSHQSNEIQRRKPAANTTPNIVVNTDPDSADNKINRQQGRCGKNYGNIRSLKQQNKLNIMTSSVFTPCHPKHDRIHNSNDPQEATQYQQQQKTKKNIPCHDNYQHQHQEPQPLAFRYPNPNPNRHSLFDKQIDFLSIVFSKQMNEVQSIYTRIVEEVITHYQGLEAQLRSLYAENVIKGKENTNKGVDDDSVLLMMNFSQLTKERYQKELGSTFKVIKEGLYSIMNGMFKFEDHNSKTSKQLSNKKKVVQIIQPQNTSSTQRQTVKLPPSSTQSPYLTKKVTPFNIVAATNQRKPKKYVLNNNNTSSLKRMLGTSDQDQDYDYDYDKVIQRATATIAAANRTSDSKNSLAQCAGQDAHYSHSNLSANTQAMSAELLADRQHSNNSHICNKIDYSRSTVTSKNGHNSSFRMQRHPFSSSPSLHHNHYSSNLDTHLRHHHHQHHIHYHHFVADEMQKKPQQHHSNKQQRKPFSNTHSLHHQQQNNFFQHRYSHDEAHRSRDASHVYPYRSPYHNPNNFSNFVKQQKQQKQQRQKLRRVQSMESNMRKSSLISKTHRNACANSKGTMKLEIEMEANNQQQDPQPQYQRNKSAGCNRNVVYYSPRVPYCDKHMAKRQREAKNYLSYIQRLFHDKKMKNNKEQLFKKSKHSRQPRNSNNIGRYYHA